MAGCLQGTSTSISTTGFGLQPSFLPRNHKPSRFHRGQRSCSEPETQNASLLGIQRGKFEVLKTVSGFAVLHMQKDINQPEPPNSQQLTRLSSLCPESAHTASETGKWKKAFKVSFLGSHSCVLGQGKEDIDLNISFLEMLTNLYFAGTWITFFKTKVLKILHLKMFQSLGGFF